MPFHCQCGLLERECAYPECHNGKKDAVSPAPTFQDGMTEADDRRFLEATSGLTSYELPRCFRCGHLIHFGECVNVAPSNVKWTS
jgi:hypothetical protein